jgi:hypothetical protein
MRGSTDDRLERNKGAVTAFYDLMFNQSRPREAVDRFVGATYIQHNPMVAMERLPSLPTSSGWRVSTRGSTWSSSG